MSESGPPSEPTGVVPRVEVRLADFLEGAPALPVALLLVVDGEARGEVLTVGPLPSVLGRSAEVDVTVPDDTVSRRHAVLRGGREAIEIEDLGSSNGTALNGNTIVGSITLHDGDLVTLGSATVLFKHLH